jgi:hypothetical protein
VRSLGTLVTPSDRGITLASDPGVPEKFWRRTVRQRVAEQPEIFAIDRAIAAIRL